MQLDISAYDREMKHVIVGTSQILQGGSIMYDTMHVMMGENVRSVSIRRGDSDMYSVYHEMHGGLVVGVSGSRSLVDDTINLVCASLQMRYGCYKTLKPAVRGGANDEEAARAPLNDPEFLPVVHSIASHITSCNQQLAVAHDIYTPRVPWQTPSISGFTNAMRYISERVMSERLLGAGVYLNRDDYVVIATTLPAEVDPIVRLVALAVSNGTMARKTNVCEIYLTEEQLQSLCASASFVGGDLYDSVAKECVCDECKLRKAWMVVTVNKGVAVVEIHSHEVGGEYLNAAESEHFSRVDSMSSHCQAEARRGEVTRVRLDFSTMMVEPTRLWASSVDKMLVKCVNLERSLWPRGEDKLLVVPRTGTECYVCAMSDEELQAQKTTMSEVDKKFY